MDSIDLTELLFFPNIPTRLSQLCWGKVAQLINQRVSKEYIKCSGLSHLGCPDSGVHDLPTRNRQSDEGWTGRFMFKFSRV